SAPICLCGCVCCIARIHCDCLSRHACADKAFRRPKWPRLHRLSRFSLSIIPKELKHMTQHGARFTRSRGILNLLVILAMFIALLAACAPAAPAGETGSTAQEPEQTTITVWGWPAADVAYDSFIADFEAANPDIKLDIQMMPTAEEHDKLLASLAAGAGAPDVAMI